MAFDGDRGAGKFQDLGVGKRESVRVGALDIEHTRRATGFARRTEDHFLQLGAQ